MNVLVADDDEDIRELTVQLFGRRGWTVETACTGEEALRALDSERFDVAVLDQDMPPVSGLEVAAARRLAGRHHSDRPLDGVGRAGRPRRGGAAPRRRREQGRGRSFGHGGGRARRAPGRPAVIKPVAPARRTSEHLGRPSAPARAREELWHGHRLSPACPQTASHTHGAPLSSSSEPLSRTTDAIDPSFVFDFRVVRRTGRCQPALVDLVRRRAALPRTRAATRLGDHRPRCRRHRARHPEDRQGGRRLPARASRRRRPVGGDGGQALPRHRPSQLPSQLRLHGGSSRPRQPGGARRGQGNHVRPPQSSRPVGERRVGVAQAVLEPRAAGALPGADRRHRAVDGVDHGRPGR